MIDEPVLLTDLTDGVLTLTLNRPERRNAITRQMWTLLRDRLRDVEPGHDVRAVVLTGAGGAFSSGADLTATTGMDEFPDPNEEIRSVNDTVKLLHDLPVPTIAKVRGGVAAGAGWNLALGCDFVVATPGVPVLPDLRPAGTVGRHRRFLAAAPASSVCSRPSG